MLTLALLVAIVAGPATAQSGDFDVVPVADSVAHILANADALTRRRDAAQCRREAATQAARGGDDIIVCAPRDEQALPVPESYGPVAGSTDGAAVRPERIRCGLSLSDPCFEGIDVFAVAGFVGDKLLDIFDPDRDLGEGTPIPERFRGANR